MSVQESASSSSTTTYGSSQCSSFCLCSSSQASSLSSLCLNSCILGCKCILFWAPACGGYCIMVRSAAVFVSASFWHVGTRWTAGQQAEIKGRDGTLNYEYFEALWYKCWYPSQIKAEASRPKSRITWAPPLKLQSRSAMSISEIPRWTARANWSRLRFLNVSSQAKPHAAQTLLPSHTTAVPPSFSCAMALDGSRPGSPRRAGYVQTRRSAYLS